MPCMSYSLCWVVGVCKDEEGTTILGLGLPRWLNSKEFACQCRRNERHGFYP